MFKEAMSDCFCRKRPKAFFLSFFKFKQKKEEKKKIALKLDERKRVEE